MQSAPANVYRALLSPMTHSGILNSASGSVHLKTAATQNTSTSELVNASAFHSFVLQTTSSTHRHANASVLSLRHAQ
jgi:hypothetical protein